MRLRDRPSIHHIGYAVGDLDAAVRTATETMGAGPFKPFAHVPLDPVSWHGEPAVYDHSAAFGMWGDIALELLQIHESGPASIHAAFTGGPLPRLHHIAWTVPDLSAAALELEEAGQAEVLRAELGAITFTFHDARQQLGHLVELHQQCAELDAFWAEVREMAAAWGGRRRADR